MREREQAGGGRISASLDIRGVEGRVYNLSLKRTEYLGANQARSS